MLCLPDAWVWDSWYADDGEQFHAFYLKASRALGDPERRHHWPIVGHSVSDDLRTWRELPDAFAPAEPPAFDDQGIWTGSVIRDGVGTWHLFYTGIDRADMSGAQRIGHATSDDLVTWTRADREPIVVADGRWYRTRAAGFREDFRDPWVFPDGDGWRMLVTAQSIDGPDGGRGCIATATSTDLTTWSVEAPLADGVGLGQLEVLQTIEVDGRFLVAFCMCDRDTAGTDLPHVTGTWTAPADGLAGPFHLDRAEPIAVEGNYAGRLVQDRAGTWNLMAFVDVDADGRFAGCLGDPVPLALTDRGTLQPRDGEATAMFRGLTS